MAERRFMRVYCERTGGIMGDSTYKVMAKMLLNEAEIVSVRNSAGYTSASKEDKCVTITMTTGEWFECSIVWDNAITHCFPFVEV